jgi:hypothetical protein
MKTYFYGPIHTPGIIKFVDVSFYVPNSAPLVLSSNGVLDNSDSRFGPSVLSNSYANNTTAIDRVTVQPGLLPNGQPTTNAALSVPYRQINLGDDWGYATVIYGDLWPGEGKGGSDIPDLA